MKGRGGVYRKIVIGIKGNKGVGGSWKKFIREWKN